MEMYSYGSVATEFAPDGVVTASDRYDPQFALGGLRVPDEPALTSRFVGATIPVRTGEYEVWMHARFDFTATDNVHTDNSAWIMGLYRGNWVPVCALGYTTNNQTINLRISNNTASTTNGANIPLPRTGACTIDIKFEQTETTRSAVLYIDGVEVDTVSLTLLDGVATNNTLQPAYWRVCPGATSRWTLFCRAVVSEIIVAPSSTLGLRVWQTQSTRMITDDFEGDLGDMVLDHTTGGVMGANDGDLASFRFDPVPAWLMTHTIVNAGPRVSWYLSGAPRVNGLYYDVNGVPLYGDRWPRDGLMVSNAPKSYSPHLPWHPSLLDSSTLQIEASYWYEEAEPRWSPVPDGEVPGGMLRIAARSAEEPEFLHVSDPRFVPDEPNYMAECCPDYPDGLIPSE